MQLFGAGCIVAVAVTHVCEALHVFPGMHWGLESSAGRYVDLACAVLGSFFPAGYFFHTLSSSSRWLAQNSDSTQDPPGGGFAHYRRHINLSTEPTTLGGIVLSLWIGGPSSRSRANHKKEHAEAKCLCTSTAWRRARTRRTPATKKEGPKSRAISDFRSTAVAPTQSAATGCRCCLSSACRPCR